MFSSTPHPAKKLHTVWTTLFVVWGWGLLTHRGRDKMAAVFQTALSNVYLWMKMYGLRLRFHWNLFLRFVLILFQHWFRYWLDADQATNHYMNQWWLVYWRIYASPGLNEWSQYSPSRYFKSALHWRHNDHDGVSNHQPHGCLLNRLFADQRKHQSSASLAFVWGIHRGPVNSPHKWPVTRKMFTFDDITMDDICIYVNKWP